MPEAMVEVLKNYRQRPTHLIAVSADIGAEQGSADNAQGDTPHLLADIKSLAAFGERRPARQHGLGRFGHARGKAGQPLAVKGRLGQAAAVPPRLAVAGQQTLAGQRFEHVVKAILFGIIVQIVLKDMLDVVGMGNETDRIQAPAEVYDITVPARGVHIKAQQIAGRAKGQKRHQSAEPNGWAGNGF